LGPELFHIQRVPGEYIVVTERPNPGTAKSKASSLHEEGAGRGEEELFIDVADGRTEGKVGERETTATRAAATNPARYASHSCGDDKNKSHDPRKSGEEIDPGINKPFPQSIPVLSGIISSDNNHYSKATEFVIPAGEHDEKNKNNSTADINNSGAVTKNTRNGIVEDMTAYSNTSSTESTNMNGGTTRVLIPVTLHSTQIQPSQQTAQSQSQSQSLSQRQLQPQAPQLQPQPQPQSQSIIPQVYQDILQYGGRALHLECGNIFDVKHISIADIVMMETDIPLDLHRDLCQLLGSMKEGSRVLSYLDLRKIWPNVVSFPFKQLEDNRNVSDRFPTSWSVQRGHHFFLWSKVRVV
jgi:hypothetical protein